MKSIFTAAFLLFFSFSMNAQWTLLNSGTTNNLNDIFFTDPLLGYCAGDTGTLLKTINGGATWTQLPAFTDASLTELHFASPDTGYINTYAPGVFRTTDGGASFQSLTPVFQVADTSLHLRGSYMSFKGRVGVMVGSFSDVPQTQPMTVFSKITVDNGNTWADFSPNLPYAYHYLEIINADTIFMAGNHLLKTTDRGATWDTLVYGLNGFPPINNKCFQIFNSKGDGVASFAYHYEYSMFNYYPDSFTVTRDYSIDGIYCMSFPEGKTGYVLKYPFFTPAVGPFCKTTDGGLTFQTINVGSFNAINMQFLTEELGYACGENGVIYKTTNGGGTTSINDETLLNENISVYPNPANGTLHLELDIKNVQAMYLIDAFGKKIKEFAPSEKTLNVKELATGNYFLQIISAKGKKQTVPVAILR